MGTNIFSEQLKSAMSDCIAKMDRVGLLPAMSLFSGMGIDEQYIDYNPKPECFHLDSSTEDQILINEEYTGLSTFNRTLGKIKENVGGIVRKEYNPTREDLETQETVQEISNHMSLKMDVQTPTGEGTSSTFSEDTIADTSSPTLKENIANTLTSIKDKLNSKVQDKRVFNGRKSVDHLCETFTDSQIIDLMKRTHEYLFGRELCVSPLLNRFLVCFQDALFTWIKENKKFDYTEWKTAHYCRMVVGTIGRYVGSGARNFQKIFSWFNSKLDPSSSNSIWASREKEKMREWKKCSSEIYDYLCVELPLIAEPD